MHRIDGVGTPVPPAGPDLLAPVRATLAAAFPGAAPGSLARELVVGEATTWIGAETLVDGTGVRDLVASVARRRRATTHAAAALAWKAYTYAVALPVVLGWAAARRVPLVRPLDVAFRLDATHSVMKVALRSSIRLAVLPSDPAAALGDPAEVVAGEAELLDILRDSLLDAHLAPVLRHIRSMAQLGSRTLLGSLASGVAHAVVDADSALPGSATDHADTLLSALGLRDLVDLVPADDGGVIVQRRTCCLGFTLPEAKICNGCCIRLSGRGPAVTRSRDDTADGAVLSIDRRLDYSGLMGRRPQ